MSDLRITVTGGRQARIAIEGLGERASDIEAARRAIIDHLHGVYREAFATGGANLPQPWRALRPATLAAKRERGFDPRTLVRRGDLEASLTRRGARWSRNDGAGDHIEFGTRSPVARLLRARGRNPVQVPTDTDPIVEILRAHVVDGRA